MSGQRKYRSRALHIYDKAAQNSDFERRMTKSPGWVWEDKYIVDDFQKLRGSEDRSITTLMSQLKTFYLLYFGELTSTQNVGALFCHLIATCPSFSDAKKDLIKFSTNGSLPIPDYTIPAGVDEAFRRFRDTEEKPVAEELDLEPPPVEGVRTGIVDEEESGPSFAQANSLHGEEVNVLNTTNGIACFKEGVKTAFNLILTTPQEGGNNAKMTGTSYWALHRTAVFLIFVMMRRLAKRPEDLLGAFGRGNLHKHYNDMVENAFSTVIPPPSFALNQTLDFSLSSSSEAGRHLGVMLLHTFWSCATSSEDTPVGYLDQLDKGLEAILRATCMTHIAGVGLPLVTLYTAAKLLYNKTDRQTLDWVAYPELDDSVCKVSNLLVTQFDVLKQGSTLKLFPYCRLVHQKYHVDMASKGNESLCYLFACMIDLQFPPAMGTGGAKTAMWTMSMNVNLKQDIETAAGMKHQITRFTLTSSHSQQVNYNSGAASGQVWNHSHPTGGLEEEEEEDGSTPITLNQEIDNMD